MMKTKLSLISSVVLLFLSLPILMGNGETGSPKDKEAIKQELDQIYDVVMKAYDQMLKNQAEFDTTEAEKERMKEIISEQVMVLFTSHPEELPSVDELAALLNEKRRSVNDTATTLADFQAKVENLQDTYNQYQEDKGPGYFESEESLQEWLDSWNETAKQSVPINTTEKINLARQQQMDALLAGFLINVNFFHNQAENKYEVACTVVIKGQAHSWEPGSSEVKSKTPGIYILHNYRSLKELQDWMKANIEPQNLQFVPKEELEKIANKTVQAAKEEGRYIEVSYSYQNEIVDYVNENGEEDWRIEEMWVCYCTASAGEKSCIWKLGENEPTVLAY